MFFALLLADVVGVVMLKLTVALNITMIVCSVVFVILAIVMFFGHNAKERIRKREAEANAKLAKLQDQVSNTPCKETDNGATV